MVKWLLAIPHLLVVGILTSGTEWDAGWETSDPGAATGWGVSLLGVLVLVAAVVLLFTGRYRQELFALIMGLNRWVYRVGAYVLLLRDEYPPLRLDQGPTDPPGRASEPPPTPSAARGAAHESPSRPIRRDPADEQRGNPPPWEG